MELTKRILEKIVGEPMTGCWLWTAQIGRGGYARLKVRNRSLDAHKYIFELLNGAVQGGLELDHLCRVRCCVNPAHLEAVPKRTNILRGKSFAAVNAAKAVCANGHPFDSLRSNGHRRCQQCNTAAVNRYKRRKAAG